MKILHTGDNHFAPLTIDEAVRCFKPIIEKAEEEEVDLIVNSGDWFDKNMLMNSPGRRESVKLFQELANIAPVIIIRGNHDPDGSLDDFPRYKTKNKVYLYTDFAHEKISDDIEVVAMPYKKKADFSLPEGLTINQADEHVVKETRKLFRNLPPKESKMRLFIGHLTITNAQMASNQLIYSGEPMYTINDIMLTNSDVYFLGHIHNHEQEIFEGLPIRYCGSHYRTTFDEQRKPGFWIWENNVWSRHSTPALKKLVIQVTEDQVIDYIQNGTPLYDISLREGADIKIRVDVEQDTAMTMHVKELEKMVGVKVEKRVIPKTTARSKEISEVKSLVGKFKEWARVVGIEATQTMNMYVEELEKSDHE